MHLSPPKAYTNSRWIVFLKFFILTIACYISNDVSAQTLALTESVSIANPAEETPFIFTIDITCSSSTGDCFDVIVRDTLPATLNFISFASTLPAGVADATFDISTREIVITFDEGDGNDLAQGSAIQIDIQVEFPDGTLAGSIAQNDVEATSSNTSPVSASATASVSGGRTPGDFPDQKIGTSRILAGGEQYWAISVGNIGFEDIDNYQVIDSFPPEVTFNHYRSPMFPDVDHAAQTYYERSDNPGVWIPWDTHNLNNRTSKYATALGLPVGVKVSKLRLDLGTVPGNGLYNPYRYPGSFDRSLVIYADVDILLPHDSTYTNCADYYGDVVLGSITDQACATTTIDSTLAIDELTASSEFTDLSENEINNASIGDTILTYWEFWSEPEMTEDIEGAVITMVLPPGLSYVPGTWYYSWSSDAYDNFDPVVETGTTVDGRDLVRFVYDASHSNQFTLEADGSWWGAGIFFKTFIETGASIGIQQSNLYYNATASTHDNCGTLDAENYLGGYAPSYCHETADLLISQPPGSAGLQSRKESIGSLDANYHQYPSTATTTPGGLSNFMLTIKNPNATPIDSVVFIDILPYVNDTEILDISTPRYSDWQPNLAQAITAPAGITVYYSTNSNPCRDELAGANVTPFPSGCTSVTWSSTPPSDITTVRSLKFEAFGVTLNQNDSIVVTWDMRTPVTAVSGEIAWNSFAYVGKNASTGNTLLPAEPIKVGITTQTESIPIVGNFVWDDTNGNGLQDLGEPGIDGVRVGLYIDTNGNGIADPGTGDVESAWTITANGGQYLFSDFLLGNYFLVFSNFPTGFNTTNENIGANDNIDSDGDTTSVITFTSSSDFRYYDLGLYNGTPPPVTEVCNNGLDDDGDGLIDCFDCDDCGSSGSCADNDSDMVVDACDQDDDNDGILDIDEGCYCESLDISSLAGTISDIGDFNAAQINLSGAIVQIEDPLTFGGTASLDEFGINDNHETGSYGLQLGVNSSSSSDYLEARYSFSKDVCNFNARILDIDVSDALAIYGYLDGVAATYTVNYQGTCVGYDLANTFSSICPTNSSPAFGNVDDHSINIAFNTCIDSMVVRIYENGLGTGGSYTFVLSPYPTCTYLDTDNDGDPDCWDLDSDDDGCNDTVEQNIADTDDDGIAGLGVPTVNSIGLVDGHTYTTQINNHWQDDLINSCQPEICNNGLDDDGDGLMDCWDCDDCSGSASCLDSDSDGVSNSCDLDDDNDGILDSYEGVGIDSYGLPGDCSYPLMDFTGPVLASGVDGQVGAVYRYSNVLVGIDALVSLDALTNASLTLIDDEGGSGQLDNFQPIVSSLAVGTASAQFSFLFVDSGTSTPATSVDRVGGTAYDIDGNYTDVKESVNFKGAVNSGLDQPTLLIFEDDGLGHKFTANGSLEGLNIDPDPRFRAFFSFIDTNRISIELGLEDILFPGDRRFSIRFDECEITDFVAIDLRISEGLDRDRDGQEDYLDLDSDNDGIYDAIEASSGNAHTNGRLTGGVDAFGIPNSVSDGLGGVDYTYANTDGTADIDAYDNDADDDTCFDTEEANVNDSDNDGIAGSGTVTVDGNGLVTPLTYSDPSTTNWQNSSISYCIGEDCSNGLDDDGDGLIDCDDPDCGVTTIEYYNYQKAFAVAGQDDFTTSTSGIAADEYNSVRDVLIDPISNKVFVADGLNHRVLRYASFDDLLNNRPAEAALGQPDLVTRTEGTTSTTMETPSGLAIATNGDLFVSEYRNNRVLKFANGATIPTGSPADVVLGQPDFTTQANGRTQTKMYRPAELLIEDDNTLWVADGWNGRVLRFDNATTLGNGAPADGVLGQTNYTTHVETVDAVHIDQVTGLAMVNGILFVGDYQANRVLIWDNAKSRTDGAPADRVLGQPDFTTDTSPIDARHVGGISDLDIDPSNNLFVQDIWQDRTTIFYDAPNVTTYDTAQVVLHQPDFTTILGGTNVTQRKSFNPNGIRYTRQGYVNYMVEGEQGGHRVLMTRPAIETDEITSITDTLPGRDLSGQNSAVFEVVTQPGQGVVTLDDSATGEFTYVPPGLCPIDVDTSYTFLYSIINVYGCIDTAEMLVYVDDVGTCFEICNDNIDNDLDGLLDCLDDECITEVGLNDPSDTCIDGTDLSFTGTPTDVNGSFTTTAGAGLTDNGDGTASFDISDAGAGTFNVTYSYINAGGCTFDTTVSVTVYALPTVGLNDPSDVCVDGSDLSFTGTPTNANGSFSTTAGGGLTDNGDGTAMLDVSTAGSGTYDVTYSYTDVNSCTVDSTVSITINALPGVTLSLGTDIACSTDNSIALSGGSPSGVGGSYSGTGVSGTTFNALTAGVGPHIITYTYTDGNSCVNTATDIIVVHETPVVTNGTGSNPTDCAVPDGSVTVTTTGGSGTVEYRLNGGTWQTSNVFSGLSAGSYNIEAQNDNGTCVVSYSSNPIVLGPPNSPNATIQPPSSDCVGETVSFTAANAGGGATYDWDFGVGASPATANTRGPHDVTYASSGVKSVSLTVTRKGCQAVDNINYTVFALPTVSLTLVDDEECSNSTSLALSGGSPTSGIGIYSGPGVSGGNFNASTAGAGTHLITYTYTDSNGCISTATDNMTVLAIPNVTNITHQDETCDLDNGSITFTFTDQAGRTNLEFSIDDGSTWPPAFNTLDNSGTFTISNLSPDTYDLWVRWDGDDCPIDLGSVIIDPEAIPTFTGVVSNDPYNCPDLDNGAITIIASGNNLKYSINNGSSFQVSNQFTGLTAGAYNLAVQDSITGCVVFSSSNPLNQITQTCTELCFNGIDDDGDGDIDENDDDCDNSCYETVILMAQDGGRISQKNINTGAQSVVTYSPYTASNLNALAANPDASLIYYGRDQTVYYWDPNTDVHGVLLDMTGLVGGNMSLTSGGGGYYSNYIYMGFEDDTFSDFPEVWRIPVSSNGLTPIGDAENLNVPLNTNTSWGDMITSREDGDVHLYMSLGNIFDSFSTYSKYNVRTGAYSTISATMIGEMQMSVDINGDLWGGSVSGGYIQRFNKDTGAFYGSTVSISGWAWDLSGPINCAQKPEICDNGVDDDDDGLIDCNDPDCTGDGNADIVFSSSGVDNKDESLEAPDGVGAELYDNGDQMVLDLTDIVPLYHTYGITWRRASSTGGNPSMLVEESTDGLTYTTAAGAPFSLTTTTFYTEDISASVDTRYLRITLQNNFNVDFDAVGYSLRCATFCPTATMNPHVMYYRARN